jgi:hypothetical protein
MERELNDADETFEIEYEIEEAGDSADAMQAMASVNYAMWAGGCPQGC